MGVDNMNYVYRSGYGITVSYQNKHIDMNISMQSFINMLCLQHFTTFEGSKQASKVLLKTTHKLPVFISDELLLFPTHSIRHNDVIYINFSNILYTKETVQNNAVFIFKNGEKLVSKQSFNKIKLQLLKTEKLLENRKFHQLKVFTMMAKQ